MNVFGLDLAKNNDSFSIVEMEVMGPYKAPIKKDVFYALKNCKTFYPGKTDDGGI